VQAAAFHHDPPLGEHEHLTPLAAVHIANVLEHQLQPSDELRVAPAINTAFLNEIGLLQRLPVWRAAFANRRAAGASPEVEPAEASQPSLITPVLSGTPPSRTANDLPAPAAATRTATLGEPGSEDGMPLLPTFRQRRWVYACAAAAALGFLALWLEIQPEVPVHALTPALTSTRAPVVVSPAPAPEPAPAAEPEDMPAMAVSEEAPEMDAAADPDPAPALPEPEPSVAAAPQVAATSAPAPTVAPTPAPEAKKQPEFRLNGIFYTVARPAAIVNGQRVCVGDWVSGATVVGIDRSQVTLQMNGQRQTCVFRKGTD
jgi:hypothetical protein